MTSAIIQTTVEAARSALHLPETFSDEQRQFFDLCLTRASHLWVGYIDDELVGVWGVIPPSLLSNWAYLWLHHSDSLKGNEFLFIRKSRIAMAEILRHYEVIAGHCVASEEKAIRWLRWLGAEFGTPEGALVPFTIRRP